MTTYDNAAPNDPVRAVQSVLWYVAFHSPHELAVALFPGSHPSYLAEKIWAAQCGLTGFWAALDIEHRSTLVELAVHDYAEEHISVPGEQR